MELLRYFRNISIGICILLFLIGALTGAESVKELWNDIWHTTYRQKEAKKELRKKRMRRQTGAENLKDACEAGVSFTGYFLAFPILLTLLIAIKKKT